MSEEQELPKTLLDELDARQNEVIRALDALNERIEATLKEWTDQRVSDQQAATPA